LKHTSEQRKLAPVLFGLALLHVGGAQTAWMM